jgi:hypothetical protein
MTYKAYFNPKDGNMNFENPSEFKQKIKDLREKRHVLEIKEYSSKRTLGANAYYFAIVIVYFCKEMGVDHKSQSGKDYMHYDVLGQELRQIEDENRPGKTKTQSTRDMSGSEFWKYINRCGLLFYDQYNGSFPPPKQLGYDTTKK